MAIRAEFCQWLRENQYIGRKGKYWAFHVFHKGNHSSHSYSYRETHIWSYEPKLRTRCWSTRHAVDSRRPNKEAKRIVIGSESQWGMFSRHLMRWESIAANLLAGISTRSASNGKLVSGLFQNAKAEIAIVPQNDKEGENWLERVKANIGGFVPIGSDTEAVS